MTKAIKLLLLLIGVLLFAVGLLLGEQIRHAKFDKYLRRTAVKAMETALIRANIGVISHFLPAKVPTVYLKPSGDSPYRLVWIV
jgi:hypothetical protein